MSSASGYAAPAQPIPYTQLDSYVNGASGDRGQMGQVAMDGASTGSPADTSATAGAAPAPSNDTRGQGMAPGASNGMDQGSMNNNGGAANPSSGMSGQSNGAATPSQPGATPGPQGNPSPNPQ